MRISRCLCCGTPYSNAVEDASLDPIAEFGK